MQEVPTTCVARRLMHRSWESFDVGVATGLVEAPPPHDITRQFDGEIGKSALLEIVSRDEIAALAAANAGGFGGVTFKRLCAVIGDHRSSQCGDYLYGVGTKKEPVITYDLEGQIRSIGFELEPSGENRHGQAVRFDADRHEMVGRIERFTGLVFPKECREREFSPVIPIVEFYGSTQNLTDIDALEAFGPLVRAAIPEDEFDFFDVTCRPPSRRQVEINQ